MRPPIRHTRPDWLAILATASPVIDTDALRPGRIAVRPYATGEGKRIRCSPRPASRGAAPVLLDSRSVSDQQKKRGDLTDADLVARVVAGDPRAEDELVRRFSRVVRIILGQLLRDSPEAEDLFQDPFCMAIEKIRRREVQDPDRVSSFIASMARNVAINHFRLRTRRRTDQDSEAVERIASAAPAQLHRVMTAERSRLVRQLINELPTDRDRELLLRFYLGADEKSVICRDLGLDSLHFNRVLHRARRRLKQLYERKSRAVAGLIGRVFALAAVWIGRYGGQKTR